MTARILNRALSGATGSQEGVLGLQGIDLMHKAYLGIVEFFPPKVELDVFQLPCQGRDLPARQLILHLEAPRSPGPWRSPGCYQAANPHRSCLSPICSFGSEQFLGDGLPPR